MLSESDLDSGGWVRAKEVLTSFSAIRSFISGEGLPRINAEYWYNAVERKVRGVIQFGRAAEGMPGFVHGGAISGVFDESIGLLSWYLGVPVATRELVVRFRQFVPVNSTMLVEGHVLPPEAWMVQGGAVMRSLGGVEHATAQASFVELEPEMVKALGARNEERRLLALSEGAKHRAR